MARASLRHSHPADVGRVLRLALIWLVILCTGGGLAAAALSSLRQPADVVAMCRQGRIDTSTLIVIDTTDALTDIQQRRLHVTVEAERDGLARGGRLTVLMLNPKNAAAPIELTSLCNPGRAADADPLFRTKSRIDKEWQESFAAPIDAALTRIGEMPSGPASPIIATIAAALTRPDFDTRVPTRRMIVISDLLEHNKGGYSQLGGGNFWKAYAASALGHTVKLDLHGATVAIDYLVRPSFAAVQGDAHRQFWVRLFVEAGARETTFIGIRAPDPDAREPVPSSGRKRRHQ